MDRRRVEALIDLARRKGVTHLRLTPDGGVEFELGGPEPEQPKKAVARARVVPRDPQSVDDFLRARLLGQKGGN